MSRKRVETTASKTAKGSKPINVGSVDAELWKRFVTVAKKIKKGTVSGYLEEALREKLERDGF